MSKKKKIVLIFFLLLIVLLGVILFQKFHVKSKIIGQVTGKIDDWEYHGNGDGSDFHIK